MNSKSIRPRASSDAAGRRMKAVRQRDTKPELALRSVLFRMGHRYRIDQAPIKGIRRRADLVFASVKLAVYVDGCFWHGCPIHGSWPKNNADFWRSKIVANQSRDAETDNQLIAAGWLPLRIWEHEDSTDAAKRIACLITELRSSSH